MNDLLEKGRGFRLSVGLSMQFPEQMEAEGGRKIYLNALNNIGSSLIGKINVDRELARAMAHEEMDPTDFANRIRSLPRGEWIASLPSPTFGETGPYPFSLEPLPIPPGHPESEYPLTAREEEQFTETLSAMHEHISDRHGVPAAPDASTTDHLPTDTTSSILRAMTWTVRLRRWSGVSSFEKDAEENGWVAVEAVDDELRRLFDDVDADPPSYDALADIRKRSRYLDTTVDIDADELRIRLTGSRRRDRGARYWWRAGRNGECPRRSTPSRSNKSSLHAASRSRSSHKMAARNLTRGRATPDVDDRFAIEVETTTPENPAKVLTNLRKAQEAGDIPLFVVRPGNDETGGLSVSTAFSRHPFALSRMVRRGSTQPTQTSRSSGGATEEGGVTAVRPASDDENRTQNIWWRDGDEIALRDASGMEHIRLPSLGKLSKDRVPAIYSYDHAADEYAVFEHGEQHIYETKSAFEDDWVRIKKPFVPEAELQTPHYSSTSYAIVILLRKATRSCTILTVRTRWTPLLDTVTTSECEETTGEQAGHIQQTPQPSIDDIADDPEAVVERFARSTSSKTRKAE